MYQDLRSKLQMYKTGGSVKVNKPEKTGYDIQDIMQGEVYCNDDGTCFVIENKYPLTYIHGGYKLGDALEIEMNSLQRICCEVPHGCSLSDYVFLDTETTGLSGGTGTVAFLIGTGFFDEGFFILRQYFIRDYDEEPAALRALNELLSTHKGLVTFNGKSFDWNLLQTRFIFNRIKPALAEPINIDLLYPSRRIWKLKLESCRLCSLEENILGEYRIDDIPGAMIPSLYFKYLEDRNAAEMVKVIKHNELDILSMVALMTRIARMTENPFDETDCEQELFGLGKIFETNGEYDMFKDCFEACMDSESQYIRDKAARRLSDAYKRNGEYDRAVVHWESMIENKGASGIYPMIELAKYYEHKEKNVFKAIQLVERAIQQSSRMGIKNNIFHEDLKKRLNRLNRKAGRG